MRRLIFALAAALTFCPPAAAAPRQPLSDFDVGRVQGLANRLVVCDLTAFLMTDPDLEADVIYVSDRLDTRLWPLRWPYYRPLNVMVDEDMRTAFRKLESRGLLKRRDVTQARTRYDAGMIESYRRANLTERAFLQDQRRRCETIVEAELAR